MRSKRIISLLLAALVAASALPMGVFAAGGVFSDVPSGHWAEADIDRAFNEKVIEGTYYNEQTGERRFAPSKTLNYAQFTTILFRAAYPEHMAYYLDEKKLAWDETAVTLARDFQYEDEDVTLEDFRQPIPRYDMAKYLVLVLISKDRFNISEYDADEILADIPDGDQVPEMYKYLVSAAYGSGLITGFDDGSFKGDKFMTRAQAAVVYCRFSDILNGKETAKPEAPAQPTVPQQPAIPVPVVPDQPQQSEQPQQPAPEAPAQPAAPKAATSEDVIAEVIRLTNEERAKEGKKALMVDTSMRECSDVRADEITGVFSHTRPNGENCFSLYPTDYWVVGENIVMVPVGSRTAVEVAEYMMDLWMNSPGHRANILKDGFTAISVGVAIKDGYAFGVQNFIDRRDTSTYAEP